ncbi:MAG: hypothetical protein WBD22_10155 [Pyrinomonadaceae bacterium]
MLNNIKIASPCSAEWATMYGNDRKRFCGDCKLNVYNLSGMTRSEADELISASEGRLCVRYYRRKDGSIITKDCPVGWANVRRRATRLATAILSLVISFFSGVFLSSLFGKQARSVGRQILYIAPEPLMGAIELPPRPSAEGSKRIKASN